MKPLALVETQDAPGLSLGLRHAGGMLRGAGAIAKGLGLLAAIRRAGVRRYSGASDLRVEGGNRAEGLCFTHKGRAVSIACDQVLLHAGVVPNTQITRALRADHRWDVAQYCFHPVTDRWGETSVAGIHMAGDGAGIAGANAAEQAGRLAALGALAALGRISEAARDRHAAPLQRALAHERAIRPFLDAAYPPARQFLDPGDDTIICRCEEVRAGDIRRYAKLGCSGPNQTKAYGRPGMGPCQGRYCGLSVTGILASANGQSPDETGYFRIRSPLKPVTLGELAALAEPET